MHLLLRSATKWRQHSLVGLIAAAMAIPASAAVIATPDTTINTDGWALGNGIMSGYANALVNPAYFGPAGIVSTSITLVHQGAVNSTTLAGVDVFVSSWWNDTQAAGSVTDVVNFFLAGGNLLLLQDDSSHDAIGAALGISSSIQASNPNTVTHPALNNGSFGAAPTANMSGNQGLLSAAAITGSGGTVAGTDANGVPTMAVWDYGAYAPGAGRMVILADVDLLSGNNANYVVLNNNGRLGLNATEYLLQGRSASAVPDSASTVLLMFSSVLVMVGFRRFARAK